MAIVLFLVGLDAVGACMGLLLASAAPFLLWRRYRTTYDRIGRSRSVTILVTAGSVLVGVGEAIACSALAAQMLYGIQVNSTQPNRIVNVIAGRVLFAGGGLAGAGAAFLLVGAAVLLWLTFRRAGKD